MTKMKYLLLFTLCLFIFPSKALADCDYQRLAELSNIASNVQINYSYSLNSDNVPVFSVHVSNVLDDIYVVDNYGNTFTGDITDTQYSNRDLKYTVYSRDNNCYGEKLVTKYLTLPAFNYYYNHEYCHNNNSSLCDLWRDSTNTDFEELYKSYLKLHEFDRNTDEETKGVNYVLIILMVVGPLFAVAITLYILKYRK